MNSTLTIKPPDGTYASADSQCLSSSPDTTQAERAWNIIPFWRCHLKFEERLETFIAMLSLLYLIGGIGFGGLLLFYTLSR